MKDWMQSPPNQKYVAYVKTIISFYIIIGETHGTNRFKYWKLQFRWYIRFV